MADFPETRWTMILRLGNTDDSVRRSAFTDLCRDYWQPLYAFARSLGHSPEDSADRVQDFMLRVVERGGFGPLDPERARMRSFLKTAFRHHLIDHVRREAAQRRGGEAVLVPLDFEAAEQHLVTSPSPEAAFDREWAHTVFVRAHARLREKWNARGKASVLDELEPFLTGDSLPSYASLATRLGQSEVALRAAIHRLREDFTRHLRAEVADTLAPGEDVHAELRQVLALRAIS